MRKPSFFIALMIAVLMVPALGQASSILHDLQDIGGSVWQYDYTILNSSLGSTMNEFTIWFDYGLSKEVHP